VISLFFFRLPFAFVIHGSYMLLCCLKITFFDVVISHNKVEAIPSLASLESLVKLSAAHNQLRVFPDLSANTTLRELRLNDNKISTIPDYIQRMPSLEILDLGNNRITNWSDVKSLSGCFHLMNLNLKGNKICDMDDFKEKVIKIVFGFIECLC